MRTEETRQSRLVVVFNHRYEANLERLDDLYREAFPDRVFVMPFYAGDREDVIPVYSSSYTFQGFFAQAWPRIRREGVTHYVFVGDDLILNPTFTSANVAAELSLGRDSAFIKELRSFADITFSWMHIWRALRPWLIDTGVEWKRELPDEATARALLARHGVETDTFTWRSLLPFMGRGVRPETLRGAAHLVRGGGRRKLPYPLAWGYSDLLVIPDSVLPQFGRYCGILAAMGVFAEVAAPTALALACADVRTEAHVGRRGIELWGREPIDRFAESHDYDVDHLLENFPPDALYVHPVKLSRWKGPTT